MNKVSNKNKFDKINISSWKSDRKHNFDDKNPYLD